jgi:hypothetical protein
MKIIRIQIVLFMLFMVLIMMVFPAAKTSISHEADALLGEEESLQEEMLSSQRLGENKLVQELITHIAAQVILLEKNDEPRSASVNTKVNKLKPFAVPEGVVYRVSGDPNTFLETQNPLSISIAKALQGKIPEELLKVYATELKIQRDAISKRLLISTEANLVPASFDQLSQIKPFAQAASDLSFIRKINLILIQEKGDLITYGVKTVGNETFSRVIVYSNKKYLRDLYFSANFKQELDKYFGTSLLVLGAKDRIQKGEFTDGKLFYQKAAEFSNNNPLVLNEAAKAILELK